MVGAADVELRIEFLRFFDEVGEAVLGGAEEVMFDVRRGILEAAVHEIRSVDAVGHDGLARGQVDAPRERHAVGDEVIDGFRASAKFRIGQAQHRDVRIGEVDNGRLLGCATVKNLRQILVARRREQGFAEENGLWETRTHEIRKAEMVNG